MRSLNSLLPKGSSFSHSLAIGVVANSPGITAKLLSQLPRERDGLYQLDELLRLLPEPTGSAGCFAGDRFMVMAHPYFRRRHELHQNFAHQFLDVFRGYNSPALTRYLAVDGDRVRVDLDGDWYMESDTWFGSPFSEDISQIPDGTIKLRPPLDLSPHHLEFFFGDTYSLHIKWSESAGIKTFQALEFKNPSSDIVIGGTSFSPVRYIHAEYDLRGRNFRHLDGAIQLYTEQDYLARRDVNLDYNAKSLAQIKARSTKLFKFNGTMEVNDWVEVCCQFLTGNPLTHEYFTGSYPRELNSVLAKIRARAEQHASAQVSDLSRAQQT